MKKIFEEQPFSAAFKKQPLTEHQLAVVRGLWSASRGQGWWSAVSQLLAIILLWAVVGGHLCTSSLKEPFGCAFEKKHICQPQTLALLPCLEHTPSSHVYYLHYDSCML